MDEATNKLYYLKGNSKIMMLDFNIPPGSSFTGQFPGFNSAHNISVTGGDSVRTFNFSPPPPDGSSTYYRVEKGLGLRQKYSSFSISSNSGISDDWSTFNQIRFNQNGDTIYKDQSWAPIITYTPETTTTVFLKTFNVNTTHDINKLYAQYIPDINFNDSLFIRSFYTNGTDSTATVVTAVAATTPVTTFNLQLDSAKMKVGYKFKYRLSLRDKYYRPKLIFHPTSIGFHTLICDPSVGLIEDDPQIPVSIDLKAYPNLFQEITILEIDLPRYGLICPRPAMSKGTLYDILGRPVADILDADFPVGENSIKFVTAGLTSGVYVFRLTTKSGSEHIKILVTK
ncbi:MAG: T9SS type A sorting domain-containing protein [Ignavibacteriales bacterium]|nr:T9SS type A sorting domain-containing protein [Ignavibacteriales bacterium]